MLQSLLLFSLQTYLVPIPAPTFLLDTFHDKPTLLVYNPHQVTLHRWFFCPMGEAEKSARRTAHLFAQYRRVRMSSQQFHWMRLLNPIEQNTRADTFFILQRRKHPLRCGQWFAFMMCFMMAQMKSIVQKKEISKTIIQKCLGRRNDAYSS